MADFKLNVGDLAEDAVQAAVEAAFSSDFVYRSPRKADNKEVTDVLVLFKDVAIVIASKAQAVGNDPQEVGDSLAWARKNIKKAGRQVSGAIRALRAGRATHIVNPRHGRIRFDQSTYPFMHGLIVANHRSEAYNAVDEAPTLRNFDAPLHVLSFRDFANLASLLDTPADLVCYLDARADVLIPTLNPQVHEEESAFFYYLGQHEKIELLRAKNHGEALTEEDIRPYSEAMRKLVGGKIDREPGLVIDHIIDRCHESDPSLQPVHVGTETLSPTDPVGKLRIATHLGAIPRIRRIALGKRYRRIAARAQNLNETTQFLSMSKKRSDCLLLMASALPREKREDRRTELYRLTCLAKEYCGVERTMGIATEEAGRMGSSFDFAYIESEVVQHDPAGEIMTLGRDIFGDMSGRLADDFY